MKEIRDIASDAVFGLDIDDAAEPRPLQVDYARRSSETQT